MHIKKYHALGQDGIADIGEKIASGDIFVNKQSPIIKDPNSVVISDLEYKPSPSSYKGANPAYVDNVILTATNECPY